MASEEKTQKESRGAIIVELLKVVEPVVSAVDAGPVGVAVLLDDMCITDELLGQDASALYESIEAGVSSNGDQLVETVIGLVGEVDDVEDIQKLDEIDDVDWETVLKEVQVEDLETIAESAKGIYETLEVLQDVELQDPELQSLGDMAMDYLLIRYLRDYHGEIYGWCKTVGAIHAPGDRECPEEIDYAAIPAAVEDPNDLPKEVFDWAAEGATEFAAMKLLNVLVTTFWGMNVPAKLHDATDKERNNFAGVGDWESDLDMTGLDKFGKKLLIPLIGYQAPGPSGGTTRFETGLKVLPLPPEANSGRLPGLALVSYGQLDSNIGGNLGEDWKVTMDGSGNLADRGVAVYPTSSGEIETNLIGLDSPSPEGDELVWTMDLTYDGDEEWQDTVLGTAVGRLDIHGFELTTSWEYVNNEFEFVVELETTGKFVIDPQGGFLDKVIPEPIEYDFDVTAGWSTTSGFYLQNGGTLEIALADNVPLGPLNVKKTFLGLELPDAGGDGVGAGDGDGPPALPASIGASPELDLGFMTARVDRLGIQNRFEFPEDGGDLGPIDNTIGFRPPDGIALSVDAGPVSGGGVLEFYPEEKRYSGVLQLQIGEISVNAVGLLKTELPGGRDGYSLLLLITAEFPPIQLSFGFTLNGLGGILGIHRSIKRHPLGDAIRSGNVDSVLFPQNVVENSDRIISDLRSIFPPTADQHVAGPMAKFGWGTPTLLEMEVGVVLQFPDFKIVIVGAFHLHLPDEMAPLVEVHLAVMGYIDPPNEMLAVEASLYDSRLVMWTISGDMAMELHWGDDAKFLLSIGGFNSRYDPPSDFPELDRVKASLGPPGGNPRLEYKGYLATTPNTFQVGAGVYLHAEAGPASVRGELSFDALFQFDPFKFVIDFLAMLDVSVWGKGLEIELDGTLKGPEPMSVSGTVKVEVLAWELQEDIDVELGSGGDSDEGLPPAEVMPQLLEELERPGNWSAQMPRTGQAYVTIAQPGADEEEDSDDEVLVHPLGGLGVRQQIVPLNTPIEKYGNAVPTDYTKFRIEKLLVDGEELEDKTGKRERFAPAKYKKMSDSEKMNSPPFVSREAGVAAGGSLVYYPGHDMQNGVENPDARKINRATTLEFETTVVDEERDTYGEPMALLGAYARMETGVAKVKARIGMPLDEVAPALRETAIAEVQHRQDFETTRPPLWGLPDEYVLGERSNRVDVASMGSTIDLTGDGAESLETTDSEGLVYEADGVTNFTQSEDDQ